MMEEEYQLDFFKENGFIRKICPSCGTPYWTQDPNSESCGVAPCIEYQFIGNPMMKRPYTVGEMRDAFISFFAERGHTPLSRYPTVARWRSDVYFTIASIADFQPHVTSGEVEPPANPLVISQPCIRFNDVDSVGRSGRHLTVFEMMGHHAFNRDDKEIYWKNETVSMCHQFMTSVLGIPSEAIKYREDPWTGGGNAGPALEVCAGGLELATLVFMTYRRDDNGDVEIKGEKYSRMPIRVIDPGYGLERMVWFSKGTPTVYDAIYPDIVKRVFDAAGLTEKLSDEAAQVIFQHYFRQAGLMDITGDESVKELRARVIDRLRAEGIEITEDNLRTLIEPVEKAYAIVDHAKALAFMISDGAVPSNSKAGYMVRLLIRRALRMMEDLSITDKLTLMDIIDLHIDSLKEYPDLRENRDVIADIIKVETERYYNTLEKGRPKVLALIKKYAGKEIPLKELAYLYDSHGLHPGVVAAIAEEEGVTIEVPGNFLAYMSQYHAGEKGTARTELSPLEEFLQSIKDKNLPETIKLYYEKEDELEFESPVIHKAKYGDLFGIVLKETAFYPEGGGQPADSGVFVYNDEVIKVEDVQKAGNVVVHFVEKDIPVGDMVHGKVDRTRRMRHTRHHTATHIILTAAKRVLGSHVWQTGSQLDEAYGRLDITHYKRLTPDEVQRIEKIANDIVLEDYPVEKTFLPRDKAEKKHGFTLYQGGPPIAKVLRVVRVGHLDAQACGGTHVKKTTDIGLIKIVHTERIQDGVERVIFSAGDVAVKRVQEMEALLNDVADTLNVPPGRLVNTVKAQLEEIKSLRKKVDELKKLEAASVMSEVEKDAMAVETSSGQVKVLSHIFDDMEAAKKFSMLTTEREGIVVVVGVKAGPRMMIARSGDVPINLRDIINEAASAMDGRGGGKPDFVQAGGKNPDGLEAAVKKAVELIASGLGNRS